MIWSFKPSQDKGPTVDLEAENLEAEMMFTIREATNTTTQTPGDNQSQILSHRSLLWPRNTNNNNLFQRWGTAVFFIAHNPRKRKFFLPVNLKIKGITLIPLKKHTNPNIPSFFCHLTFTWHPPYGTEFIWARGSSSSFCPIHRQIRNKRPSIREPRSQTRYWCPTKFARRRTSQSVNSSVRQ